MKTNDWRTDTEYIALVDDLLAKPEVQKLGNYTQHHHSDRLTHSISVSYDSYLIAKKTWPKHPGSRSGGAAA